MSATVFLLKKKQTIANHQTSKSCLNSYNVFKLQHYRLQIQYILYLVIRKNISIKLLIPRNYNNENFWNQMRDVLRNISTMSAVIRLWQNQSVRHHHLSNGEAAEVEDDG